MTMFLHFLQKHQILIIFLMLQNHTLKVSLMPAGKKKAELFLVEMFDQRSSRTKQQTSPTENHISCRIYQLHNDNSIGRRTPHWKSNQLNLAPLIHWLY